MDKYLLDKMDKFVAYIVGNITQGKLRKAEKNFKRKLRLNKNWRRSRRLKNKVAAEYHIARYYTFTLGEEEIE